MSRKDWDVKLETHNEAKQKALVGMLTSRILSSSPTNNDVHRRDTRAFNRKDSQVLPPIKTETMQHILQDF